MRADDVSRTPPAGQRPGSTGRVGPCVGPEDLGPSQIGPSQSQHLLSSRTLTRQGERALLSRRCPRVAVPPTSAWCVGSTIGLFALVILSSSTRDMARSGDLVTHLVGLTPSAAPWGQWAMHASHLGQIVGHRHQQAGQRSVKRGRQSLWGELGHGEASTG